MEDGRRKRRKDGNPNEKKEEKQDRMVRKKEIWKEAW